MLSPFSQRSSYILLIARVGDVCALLSANLRSNGGLADEVALSQVVEALPRLYDDLIEEDGQLARSGLRASSPAWYEGHVQDHADVTEKATRLIRIASRHACAKDAVREALEALHDSLWTHLRTFHGGRGASSDIVARAMSHQIFGRAVLGGSPVAQDLAEEAQAAQVPRKS